MKWLSRMLQYRGQHLTLYSVALAFRGLTYHRIGRLGVVSVNASEQRSEGDELNCRFAIRYHLMKGCVLQVAREVDIGSGGREINAAYGVHL